MEPVREGLAVSNVLQSGCVSLYSLQKVSPSEDYTLPPVLVTISGFSFTFSRTDNDHQEK